MGLVARAMGAGNPQRASLVLAQSAVLAMMTTMLFGIFIVYLPGWYLTHGWSPQPEKNPQPEKAAGGDCIIAFTAAPGTQKIRIKR